MRSIAASRFPPTSAERRSIARCAGSIRRPTCTTSTSATTTWSGPRLGSTFRVPNVRNGDREWVAQPAFQLNKPALIYRRANLNFNQGHYWTVANGTPTEIWFNFNWHAELQNLMWVHLGANSSNPFGEHYNVRQSRGDVRLFEVGRRRFDRVRSLVGPRDRKLRPADKRFEQGSRRSRDE